MTDWTKDELTKIGETDELRLSSLRADGTLGQPVTIWVVRVGNDLYVRSVKGRGSIWFRGTLERHMGHIRAGGLEKDVDFVEEDDPILHLQIDDAYRAKYRRYPVQYVDAVIVPKAKAATLKLAPRE